MSLFQTFNDIFWLLLDPWLFMWLSAKHIPSTIGILIAHQAFSTLFSPSGFSEALFGNFWANFGPLVKENAERRVIPLLEGRVSQGKVHDEKVELPVGGVVVEVGAGSGMWADVFKKIGGVAAADADKAASQEGVRTRRRTKAAADQGTISKIYGIEPNPVSYTALRQRVKDIGLDEVYEVVPVGIEDITDTTAWDGKIEKGSVDCIVGVLCLCSIPDQEENARHLYELLKPGGRWYVYEHVKVTRGGLFMRLYQRKSCFPPPTYLR
ncbi:hypothetical protein NLU13_5703 [Sarocladium strictum]|uniref:Uncharacterized protein n=1 Tax=Sarocladium strictum TaxID=5046 RepID=A0AA39L7G8_SARSR|nr:hypothetical protein NLU13_5703 [Sarocladium strictum]